jgi:hypothetical protein
MSKTANHIIKKGLVLTLLTGYLFIALPYVFYIPLHTYSEPTVSLAAGSAQLDNKQQNSNTGLLLHCISKCVTENKRNAPISLLETMIVSSLVFMLFTLPVFKNKRANRLKIAFNTHANFYLDFCSLRI